MHKHHNSHLLNKVFIVKQLPDHIKWDEPVDNNKLKQFNFKKRTKK